MLLFPKLVNTFLKSCITDSLKGSPLVNIVDATIYSYHVQVFVYLVVLLPKVQVVTHVACFCYLFIPDFKHCLKTPITFKIVFSVPIKCFSDSDTPNSGRCTCCLLLYFYFNLKITFLFS